MTARSPRSALVMPMAVSRLSPKLGKGRHPAGLNYGDCLTYAAAKLSGLPLLCLGEDFAQTDLSLVPLTVSSDSVAGQQPGHRPRPCTRDGARR
jgi:hypothetical protein